MCLACCTIKQSAQRQVKHNPRAIHPSLGNECCINQLGSQQMPHVVADQIRDISEGFSMIYWTEIKGERSVSW